MRDYTTIDWSQDLPADADLRLAFVQSWVRSRPLDPRIARVQALFHEDRTSARMAAAQFDLDLDPAYAFFLQRKRLPETLFFYQLFNSLDFQEAVPAVGNLRWSPSTLNDSREGRTIGQGQGLKLVDGWGAFASLAGWIRNGGLHIHEARPTDRRALSLTLGVARAAFSGQMRQGSCYRGAAPWCDWFDGEEQDTTLVFIDHRAGVATVILLTDGP
jgi:hypothetical protein